ncbi:MAG: hypothetical protein H6985_04520 [Pseudomonadales bacterium]|nr:hypothetical protein [Pseudomonadales bacterium]
MTATWYSGKFGKKPALALLLGALLALPNALSAYGAQPTLTELETEVASLSRQLAEANARLEEARRRADTAEKALADTPDIEGKGITLGPVTIGGAMRLNYIYGDYEKVGDAPQRGGDGGNVELDTFRINASLKYEQWIGQLEYRWYDGYNFIHTGWLGYAFDDSSQIEVGVTRVPFGPGPYGISQSWFFDQHYYVGLADDPDLGVKYLTQWDNWELALAYFVSSEANGNGGSADSARYGYDAVKWRFAVEPNGDVVDAPTNGYEERNQFNLRAIYQLEDVLFPTDMGFSMEWGELDGKRAQDGHHWALSGHMVSTLDNITLAAQITRYKFDVDDSKFSSNQLIPLGAYDFAWPAAADGWIPAVSLSYRIDTPGIPWLGYILPYIEYSSIVKDDNQFNNSDLFILGSAWASGGWYIYSDLAYSNGNYFVGDKGDNYSNIYDGVGDFGADGNDKWNYRFNLNMGYYY